MITIESGTVIGNYRILAEVGTGGMGKVYRSLDTMLRREVAIKVLRPEMTQNPALVERFRNEAVVLARLSHPHIAMLYNLLQHEDMFFMVMEFVVGETLDVHIRNHGAPTYGQALKWFLEVLEALGYAHENGVIHRDIKPSNIMITQNHGVKVMDFGIARVLGSERMTREGSMVGTVEYMAPEQIRGQDSNERTDIYTLGLLLYELICGRLPFMSTDHFELMRAHIEAAPPAPRLFVPHLAASVETVILKALAKTPTERFASAQEFRQALQQALRDSGSYKVYEAPVTEPEFSLEDELARLAAESQREADAVAAETRQRLMEEARRKSTEEAVQLAAAERKKLVATARKQAEAEAAQFAITERTRLLEIARQHAEQEAARQAATERQRLLEEARQQAEAEAAQRAEVERQRRLEEARQQAESEATQRAEIERARLIEEARLQAERQAAHLATAERQRLLEAARKQAEAEAARLAVAEEKRLLQAARKQAEAEAAEVAAAERQALLAEAQHKAEIEASQRAEAERRRLIEEARRQAENEAAARAAIERQRLLKAAREQAEIEAAQLAAEEETRLFEQARKSAELEAAQLAKAERTRLLEDARRRAEHEAAQRAAQERQRLVDEARKQAEAEAARLGAEEQQRLMDEARKQSEAEAARWGEEERTRLYGAAQKRAEAEAQKLAAKERKRLIAEEKKRAKEDARRASAKLQSEVDSYATSLLASAAVSGANETLAAGTWLGEEASMHRRLVWVVVAVLLLGGAFVVWRYVSRPAPPVLPRYEVKMISVPGGKFRQGRAYPQQAQEDPEWAALQQPAHEIISAPFEMDRTEITNAEYAHFVNETKYAAPADWGGPLPRAGEERWPVRNVSLRDAEAFAAWRSKRDGVQYRLPTESEWELAAKGTTAHRYPWGDDWHSERANVGTNVPKPVGSYLKGASPFGLLDMLGNASEWTASPPTVYPGNATYTQQQVQEAYGSSFTVRGSSFADPMNEVNPPSVTARGFFEPATKQHTIGFRLVYQKP